MLQCLYKKRNQIYFPVAFWEKFDNNYCKSKVVKFASNVLALVRLVYLTKKWELRLSIGTERPQMKTPQNIPFLQQIRSLKIACALMYAATAFLSTIKIIRLNHFWGQTKICFVGAE